MPLLQYNDLLNLLKYKLEINNFEEEAASLCAKILTENTFAGVASHGTNRFAAFVNLARQGLIKPHEKPSLVNSFGTWEQWDGNLGPGPLNAWHATGRAIEIAKETGMGCVALKNTNHWMRGGTYGWRAADEGIILLCWTNAYPMMPPWGAKKAALGNNPFVLAVPREKGNVVMDMALSQYAFGKLANYRREGKELPYPGGYNQYGELTTDAGDIYDAKRPLPIGYWKGSGLSILFDIIAVLLSGGKSSNQLGQSEHESSVSQVFIAFDPQKSHSAEAISQLVDDIIDSVKKADPINDGEEILYPGERALKTREKNLLDGVFVEDEVFEKINAV